jgi:ParB-like chromosome segregation protein Spo0J
MRLSLSRVGQLTAVQAYRVEKSFEVFDGLKRLYAARELAWETLRVEVHTLDAVGAKVRLLCCNSSTGLSHLEEAWLVRSLYREDKLNQPQIAMLLSRHKSWVCRRLALAEGLSDELTAHVRLGLVPATAAVELARLPRCNQDDVIQAVARRGLTTRQIARLVQKLLVVSPETWPALIGEPSSPPAPLTKPGLTRRTPAEQLVCDAWAMRRLAVRLQARLLERSLLSLGEGASGVVSQELQQLSQTLSSLVETLHERLSAPGTVYAN